MKTPRFIPRLSIATVTLALSTVAGMPASAQGIGADAITAPGQGVLCDAAGPTCYDSKGPSIGHTQTYFGRTAADQLQRQLAGRPPVQDFRISNGAVCDTRARLCWSDGFSKTRVAPRLTQQLFGSVSSNGTGLNLPQAGVACDPAGQLCYDRMGLSLGLTREYYGSYAEQTALGNLRGQAPPRQFRLSTGSACDVDARTCWSDGWQRRVVDSNLSRHLFGVTPAGVIRQGECRLSRLLQVLSSGSCQLSEQRGPQGRSLQVSLRDGSVYSFSKRRGEGFRITDGKGASWPVRLSDQGSSISFSWADRVLTMTPQGQKNPSAPSLGQLIDALLGN